MLYVSAFHSLCVYWFFKNLSSDLTLTRLHHHHHHRLALNIFFIMNVIDADISLVYPIMATSAISGIDEFFLEFQ